jgi:SagB-type dehydrogenase family enzyme
MRLTRYEFAERSDQQQGVEPPPLTRRHPQAGAETVPLPLPQDTQPEPLDFLALVTSRESRREYADLPLSLAELSFLLWCTQGVKQVCGRHATLRTVPSAGARHALETYLIVNRVDGLDPGLYQYLPLDHELAAVPVPPGVARRVAAACLGQEMLVTCAAAFIWTAVPYRMAWRYGQRAYRYLHLDAGHVCQNLYLAAEAIGCGACAIAAFHDDAMAAVLELDPVEEFVIYLATVGRRGGKAG